MFQVSGFMLLVPCCLLLVACRLYSGTKLVEVQVSKFWEMVLGSWFLGITADCILIHIKAILDKYFHDA
jgi:hypothetical protein